SLAWRGLERRYLHFRSTSTGGRDGPRRRRVEARAVPPRRRDGLDHRGGLAVRPGTQALDEAVVGREHDGIRRGLVPPGLTLAVSTEEAGNPQHGDTEDPRTSVR